MATVLISFLFSPFLYGLEFFLASTLTTQVALSVATIVVSTATIFYCQRAFYQWYEDTAEFIVRIRNKVGLNERHVTFTVKGQKTGDGNDDGTEQDSDPPLEEDNADDSDQQSITTAGYKIRLGSDDHTSTKEKSSTKEKPALPMDSWLQKQTVAMHRSHWVAKPGRIAPTTFIGFGRRGSADNTPTLSSGKGPTWTLGADALSEQRTKATLDRRQSSPSSLGTPLTKTLHEQANTDLVCTATNIGLDNENNTSTSGPEETSGTKSTPSVAIEVKSPKSSEEVPRDLASIENSSVSSEDVAVAQDDKPREKLIPTETEVKEALLVDGSKKTPSPQANVQSLPSESNSESDGPTQSQTSEERSSGQTDTDSLATDDIFSDSELDDSKRSDDVFLHDDDEDRASQKAPLLDISVKDCTRSKCSLVESTQPDIVVYEADTKIRVSENTEAEPDSSVSLSVEGGPIPRKDSFGLLPVLKGRVHRVKIETTSYTGPVTAISIEETKSESDSEIAAITHGKDVDKSNTSDDSESSRGPVRLAPQKQDSLGVPPVVVGEVSFPGITPKAGETPTASKGKISISKMPKVDSLDVPPVIQLEESLPPYPIGSSKSKEQLEHYQEVRVRLPPKMSLPGQGRPNSLDIPSLNISESCPPRRYSCDSRTFPLPSSNSFRNIPCSNKGRKQGPSILKRSGSVDRTGPKKSVTFSPIVIPWGGSSEEGIEPSGECYDLKRHSSSSSSPIRPKVIRYNSVDVPETMRRRQRTEFIRQLGMPAENSDEDQESWEQGKFVRFYRKSNQRDDKQMSKLDRKRSGIDEGPIKTDSIEHVQSQVSPDLSHAMGKSAKERFLEAGGARAVMSVLVTQDSSDRSIISSASSTEGKDSPPERTDDSATSWAKSRFLMSGDGNMRASRLFVERVRGSMDMSETPSDNGSPSDTNEDTSSSSDQQFEETEEGGIRSTSAKSRFLWSCRENTSGISIPPGSLPVDRLFALWEPTPLTLPEVPEADEAEEENTSKSQSGETVKSKTDLPKPTSDCGEVPSKEEIDSPGSSGVHSMEPEETAQERILSLKENEDSQTKHVPSNLSTSSTSSRGYGRQLKTAIVFDNGSQYMKVGLIDEKKPSIELPNVISRDIVESFNSRFIGLEAVKNCTVSPYEYPTVGGLIQNWDDVESIWKHIFDAKLGLTPQEHPLLMTEIATVPKQQREKTMEILFETFNIPALYFANQASLSLRATGNNTGLALSSGSGVTEVVPVYNGVTLSRAVTKLDLGGRSATKYLAHLIEKDTGRRLVTSPGAMEVLRELKEDQTNINSKVGKAPTGDEYDDVPWHCWLPDGSTVEVKREFVQTCAEPLFQPALAGILHQPGMPNLVADCLDRCDQNMLSEFPSTLLLCGGNTYLGGFTDRLQSELNTLGLGYITVEAPKGRDLLPWVGGALLASQLDNESSWIELDEYVENGASLVHKRCT